MLIVLDLNIINLNFDSLHNCRGYQHYWPRLSFGLIGSCYHDNYRNKNFSIFRFPL